MFFLKNLNNLKFYLEKLLQVDFTKQIVFPGNQGRNNLLASQKFVPQSNFSKIAII